MRRKRKGYFFNTFVKKTKDFTRSRIKKSFTAVKKRLKEKNIFKIFLFFFYTLFKFVIKFVVIAHILFFFLIFISCLFLKFFNPPATSLMSYRAAVEKQKNQPVVFIPLKNIPIVTQKKVVLIEDYRFYEHKGIDIEAIKYAYNLNKRLGYKYAGGSTISQQLARNLFLTPEKSYFRKYLEVFIALEMELVLGKKRILELYINYIEFGKGIYGIGRASLFYYGKSFYKLTSNEINRLLAIIPSPRRYNPWNFANSYHLLQRYMRLNYLFES